VTREKGGRLNCVHNGRILVILRHQERNRKPSVSAAAFRGLRHVRGFLPGSSRWPFQIELQRRAVPVMRQARKVPQRTGIFTR